MSSLLSRPSSLGDRFRQWTLGVGASEEKAVVIHVGGAGASSVSQGQLTLVAPAAASTLQNQGRPPTFPHAPVPAAWQPALTLLENSEINDTLLDDPAIVKLGAADSAQLVARLHQMADERGLEKLHCVADKILTRVLDKTSPQLATFLLSASCATHLDDSAIRKLKDLCNSKTSTAGEVAGVILARALPPFCPFSPAQWKSEIARLLGRSEKHVVKLPLEAHDFAALFVTCELWLTTNPKASQSNKILMARLRDVAAAAHQLTQQARAADQDAIDSMVKELVSVVLDPNLPRSVQMEAAGALCHVDLTREQHAALVNFLYADMLHFTTGVRPTQHQLDSACHLALLPGVDDKRRDRAIGVLCEFAFSEKLALLHNLSAKNQKRVVDELITRGDETAMRALAKLHKTLDAKHQSRVVAILYQHMMTPSNAAFQELCADLLARIPNLLQEHQKAVSSFSFTAERWLLATAVKALEPEQRTQIIGMLIAELPRDDGRRVEALLRLQPFEQFAPEVQAKMIQTLIVRLGSTAWHPARMVRVLARVQVSEAQQQEARQRLSTLPPEALVHFLDHPWLGEAAHTALQKRSREDDDARVRGVCSAHLAVVQGSPDTLRDLPIGSPSRYFAWWVYFEGRRARHQQLQASPEARLTYDATKFPQSLIDLVWDYAGRIERRHDEDDGLL